MDTQLDEKIIERGKEFFTSISGEAPSIFNKGWWTGKVMDWAMKNEEFKVQLFRFVDVFPYLNTSESLSRHIREYFSGEDSEVPAVLKWGAGKAGIGGKLTAKLMEKTIRSNIEGMGRQFIVGQNTKEAVKGLAKLRKDGFAFTVDLLGEATVSEQEADAYKDGYLEVLEAIAKEQGKWPALGGGDAMDWGACPKVNVSIKPSALYSQAKPVDVEGSVRGIMKRLVPIYRKVIEMNGFLCIDMEALKYREVTLELYRRMRSEQEFRSYPHLSIVLQAYLKTTDKDLEDLLGWARTEQLPIAIRLVKGAYWDYETVIAKQNGWDIPVWTHKPESDIAFERQTRKILENSDICYYQCASHNIRSIAATMEMAGELGVGKDRYEFQVLYGMAEPVRKGLLNVAGRVRLYCPYGELIPGMAYLVRRLLENTANESFLRQSFADGAEVARLLENPEKTLERERAGKKTSGAPESGCSVDGLPPFENDAQIDFTIPECRAAFPAALRTVREQAGGTIPLFIDGREVVTDTTIPTTNPANYDEKLADVCQAGTAEIDMAIDAAERAFYIWRDVSAEDRSSYLMKAAEVARKRAYELSAWQVLEIGKQWDQAYHDVGEGIDFLEYYAREMRRLGKPRRMGRAPGEYNQLFYQPKGIAAVISPWNFPFAIAIGMSSAAIVTGNPVIYKPASISSRIGYNLTEVFREAGLPDGVFNYCPGKSSVMGDYLIEHPKISAICFTGSMEVGLHIQQRAAVVQPGQTQCKRVVAEMGGKNAIIIDDDADLDEAVLQVLYSAFGFQGQKCSACSRVIVLEPIYDRFIKRLVEAANDVKIGPAEDPANYMGPLADATQQRAVSAYLEVAEQEGTILVKRDVPAEGAYVPLTIVGDIKPHHRLAQEEIFGPILSVLRAKDFDEALDIANGTPFALTGGIFSRSPERLERARKEFRVGNLYMNRNNTGALVERQPFGGFQMSGVGSKTGGPDYLLQFMDPRCVTENTIRRGFAPIEEGDDWV